MNAPQGLEKLVALAGLTSELREKVLSDPLAAAEEAELELSDSEKAIIESVPRDALAGMIDRFAGSAPRPSGFGKVAAGAAAALLAATLSGCGDDDDGKDSWSWGARPDLPPIEVDKQRAAEPQGVASVAEALIATASVSLIGITVDLSSPPVVWDSSLEEALAQAGRRDRAVRCVFLHPDLPSLAGGNPSELDEEARSQKVSLATNAAFRTKTRDVRLVGVKVYKPTRPPATADADERKLYEEKLKVYEKTLKQYGVTEFPTTLLLAPDGTELARLVQPMRETNLAAAINQVPELLAKWRAGKKKAGLAGK